MRMWMINPRIMCNRHLLGEHNEIHMLIGSLAKKIKIDGFIKNNLIEPKSIIKRHQELVEEIERRGYKHNSLIISQFEKLKIPTLDYLLEYLPEEYREYKIDKEKSLIDLLSRCQECKKRQEGIHGNKN